MSEEINEEDFKYTLENYLKQEFEKPELNVDKNQLYEALNVFPKCHLSIEYTGLFTYQIWDTYQAVLHLAVPIESRTIFEGLKPFILQSASTIFGRKDDFLLTGITIDILISKKNNSLPDLSVLNVSDSTKQAIDNAKLFMSRGEYSSAIDRVHTALMGYLRHFLNKNGVSYGEYDTLSQLFTKAYGCLKLTNNNEINKEIKKIIRSASGVISTINDLRNWYSLAHPNDYIVGENEALLAIELSSSIVNYLDSKNKPQ